MKKMNNNAQMMVMESVIFAISVIIALAFLFQISPTSALTDQYTKELNIQGDDALRSLYLEPFTEESMPTNFPTNKLVYYLITNDYDSMTSDLNQMLINTEYNIKISNVTDTVFWCNSNGDDKVQLENRRAISTSHCIVAIDPMFLDKESNLFTNHYKNADHCLLKDDFPGYTGNTYKVLLEVWSLK